MSLSDSKINRNILRVKILGFSLILLYKHNLYAVDLAISASVRSLVSDHILS